MKHRITRRSFLATTSATLALSAAQSKAQTAASPLVWVQHPGATDEHGVGKPETVANMVHTAVCELTGETDSARAWTTLVKPEDTVGLKVNLRGGPHLSTQPCVVNAIIEGLQAAGVAPNNIIVWDAWTKELKPAGYTRNTSDKGVRYFCNDFADPSAGRREDRDKIRGAYSSEGVKVGDKTIYFSRIITDMCTALINVPMIKDHVIAGVTCAMKNHYGSIYTPEILHKNQCDPYLGELNKAPEIREKTRLILVDGLRALYHGGPRDNPQFHWNPNSIIAGKDPVAMDALALNIIDEKREEKGKDPVAPKAHYIKAAEKTGLGSTDLTNLKRINQS